MVYYIYGLTCHILVRQNKRLVFIFIIASEAYLKVDGKNILKMQNVNKFKFQLL